MVNRCGAAAPVSRGSWGEEETVPVASQPLTAAPWRGCLSPEASGRCARREAAARLFCCLFVLKSEVYFSHMLGKGKGCGQPSIKRFVSIAGEGRQGRGTCSHLPDWKELIRGAPRGYLPLCLCC